MPIAAGSADVIFKSKNESYKLKSVLCDDYGKRCDFSRTLLEDNKDICDGQFLAGRKTLTVQDYMLKNKTDAAFQLLEKKGAELVAPKYIQEAVAWIRA